MQPSTPNPPPNSYMRALTRLHDLTARIESDDRAFIPLRQGYPEFDARLKLEFMATVFGGLLVLSTLMSAMYDRFQEPLLPIAIVAVPLVLMALIFLREHARALTRREAILNHPDETTPGWRLDFAARRLEPQRLPRQSAIDLGGEGFVIAVTVFRHKFFDRWAALELRHPQDDRRIELTQCRLLNSALRGNDYATRPEYGNKHQPAIDELIATVEAQADALARRLGLRRLAKEVI